MALNIRPKIKWINFGKKSERVSEGEGMILKEMDKQRGSMSVHQVDYGQGLCPWDATECE